MSNTNSFHCPKCGKFTRHIKISYHEMCALNMKHEKINADNAPLTAPILHGLGIAHDFLGLTRVQSFFGYNYWKCYECGLGTRRSPSGEIDCTHETF